MGLCTLKSERTKLLLAGTNLKFLQKKDTILLKISMILQHCPACCCLHSYCGEKIKGTLLFL